MKNQRLQQRLFFEFLVVIIIFYESVKGMEILFVSHRWKDKYETKIQKQEGKYTNVVMVNRKLNVNLWERQEGDLGEMVKFTSVKF